jgi:AcrR family transcriptional regulator
MSGNTGSKRARAVDGRERVLETAYRLFRRHGLRAIGVDRIVADAGVAKTTLYRHFPSKDDLAVAVLEHHGEVWTRGWLQSEIDKRAATPAGRILALFDAFDSWFRGADFRGCLFLNTLLESRDPRGAVHDASRAALADIRAIIRDLAQAAGARDPGQLAAEIQVLLMGSIAAAVNGFTDSAMRMRPVARQILEREGILAP